MYIFVISNLLNCQHNCKLSNYQMLTQNQKSDLHFFQTEMICGGTGQEQAATEDVQNLVDGVKSDIVTKLGSNPAVFQATHFKTQVVAGTNYFVKIHIGEEKFIHVRIYKHFSGSVQLHGVKHHDVGGVQADVQLEYFEQNMN